VKSNAGIKSLHGHPGHSRHGQGLGIISGPGMGQVATLGMGPDTMLIYDEYLQQHRRPVSKLDLEEKRRREAREKGTHHSHTLTPDKLHSHMPGKSWTISCFM